MTQEFVQPLQALMKLLQCGRRNQKATPTTYNSEVKGKREYAEMKKGCELADMSTDAGSGSEPSASPDLKCSASPGISKHSGSAILGGGGDSDSSDSALDRLPKVMAFPFGNKPFSAPPGLSAPLALSHLLETPGLSAPPGHFDKSEHPWARNRVQSRQVGKQTEAPWNLHAAPFTPNCANAASMMSDMTPKASDIPVPAGLCKDNNLVNLKDALNRLDATEMATVKSLLDMKMRDAGVAEFGSMASQRPFTPFGAQPGAARPFDSFQGTQTSAARPFSPFQGTQTRAGRQFTPFGTQASGPRASVKHSTPERQVETSGDTLRTFLLELATVDNARVLTLRKINRLGMDSPTVLEKYFSKFGKVERIMVSHMHAAKPTGGRKTQARPAALGFAVMSNAEDAQAALKHGLAHAVAGVEIAVGPFQSHTINEGQQ